MAHLFFFFLFFGVLNFPGSTGPGFGAGPERPRIVIPGCRRIVVFFFFAIYHLTL